MKNSVVVLFALLASLAAIQCVRADLLDCEEKMLPSLADLPGIGPKIASAEDSGEHEVRDFFKKVGCSIKKQAKQFGSDIKEGAKKLGEKAKDLGSDIKDKFDDFKDKLSHDSSEEHNPRRLLANVEIINPDILKAEQQCGHGHILDALGNCSKLRK